MDDRARILALAQSIYLAKNNRYNDVEGTEEDEFIAQSVDWVNQWVDELELEADWNYVRRNRVNLGTINTATQTFALPDDVRTLVVSPYRSLVISQDGAIVSTFTIVAPNQIGSPPYEGLTEARVTVVGRRLIFSRNLTEEEIGGSVLADIIDYIPRLEAVVDGQYNSEMLDLVAPKQLIVLGVAKNATLPDIVQGGISPSITQKYNDLLQKAILQNNLSADSYIVERDDLSFIQGVW